MDNFNDWQKAYFEKQQEKRAVYRTAWAVLIPCMVFFLVTELWGVAILFFGGKIGFTKEQIVTVFKDPVVLQILQVALSMLLLTVPFILCAKLYGANISSITALKKPKSENNLAYFLFGIGFCAFANIAVSAAGRIFKSFGIDFSMPQNDNPEGISGFLLVVISTALVPALVEEFAFRGIVFGLLKPYGEAFAILASAAAFGVLHGNFEQIPFAFMVGLVLGFVRLKTDSLLICMAIHAANNFIAVLLSYSGAVPAAVLNILYTAYVMLALTLSVLGVAFLKDRETFTFKTAKTVGTVKSLYVNFFFSPAFIIFFLLFFARAVIYLIVY